MKKLLLFTTTIKSQLEITLVRPILESFPEVIDWSVDLEDWEYILRIEVADTKIKNSVSAQIRGLGFACNELDH